MQTPSFVAFLVQFGDLRVSHDGFCKVITTEGVSTLAFKLKEGENLVTEVTVIGSKG